jgi:hypothetical protein
MGEIEPQTIASLADVRRGDLIFTNIGGIIPGVIPVKFGMLALGERVRIGRRSFDHVIIVTGEAEDGRPPVGVQAMPRGAERVELTEARHWNDRTAVVRIPQDWPGQAADAARIAELMADARTPYSFASYLALALWRFGMKTPRLEAWIDRRAEAVKLEHWSNGPERAAGFGARGGRLPAEAICSVLVDQAWSLAGKRVVAGVAPQAVSPGRLVLSLWRRPGAVWSGPGLDG